MTAVQHQEDSPSSDDPEWSVVIGDLVGSRGLRDRRAAHRRLVAGLGEVDQVIPPMQPGWVTAGDEFQWSHRTVGESISACLRLRARLFPLDLRVGIGWGTVQLLGQDGVQDGPAWWSAREAINAVERMASQPATTHCRMALAWPAESGFHPATGRALNAALLCCDQLLGSVDERGMRLLTGLLAGKTQAELAASEGISPSAVSQRVRRDALSVILLADQQWRGV